MAKRRTLPTDGRTSLDQNAYHVDPVANTVDRAVYDEEANAKLANIASVLGAGDTTPTIINLNIINSGTEYSQALPANTKTFLIKSRNKGQVRLAYALGGTNTAYLTIPAGSSFEDSQFYTAATLYLQSTKSGDIIEIVAYS